MTTMKRRGAGLIRSGCVFFCLVLSSLPALAQQPPAPSPRELVHQLDNLEVNPSKIYLLRHARLFRGPIHIYFHNGFVGFFPKIAGQVTGAMFSGKGEILLMPRSMAERRSLVYFIGSPLLDEHFDWACLRFSDATASELLADSRKPYPGEPEQPGNIISQWNPLALELDPDYSLRILADLIGSHRHPYFGMVIHTERLGTIEVTDDKRLEESVSVVAQREQGGVFYRDVLCAIRSRASESNTNNEKLLSPGATSYRIDTTIHRNGSLDGVTRIGLVSSSNSDRLLFFELSRHLKVLSVKDDRGEPLEFFEAPAAGYGPSAGKNLDVAVALRSPVPAHTTFYLTFKYGGHILANEGNEALYVGAHASWYPRFGWRDRAAYDLTFHYPSPLTLVATGHCIKTSHNGQVTTSRWISDGEIPVAGFNLGFYREQKVQAGAAEIEAFATNHADTLLEQGYLKTLPHPPGGVKGSTAQKKPPPLDPAARLDNIAMRASKIVNFYSRLYGPLPYPQLIISEIPGGAGQSWPELIYLPTFTFLTAGVQKQLGINPLTASTMLPHEIAHQWWGNDVGWATYHDQWLSEGVATFSAALFMEHEQPDADRFHRLLALYRQDLLATTPARSTVAAGGPIWLGQRLSNSLNPEGYSQIVYKKACWVMQMLRIMMRDPTTGSDQKFFEMLRGFLKTYAGRDPSTGDFERWVTRHMTPAMDLDHNHSMAWFFNEWVYGISIPSYVVNSTITRLPTGGYRVRGDVRQKNVHSTFEMLVPLVAVDKDNHATPLGSVAVGVERGKFLFTIPHRPVRVEVNQNEILTDAH